MTPSSLALLAQSAAAGDATSTTWKFLDLPELWVVALVIVPLAVGLSLLAYWREALSRPVRITLVTLRSLSFLLLCVVLFRPVFVKQEQLVIPPEVLILVDDSGSMASEDPYAGDDDMQAAVTALAGKPAGQATRAELALAASRRVRAAAEAAGYVPKLLRFADDLGPLPAGRALEARGTATAIGDGIRGALSMHRGEYVTDVVVISDGRSNLGAESADGARSARAAGIAVNTVLVGDDRTEVNVAVELVDAPETVLEGDEIEIAARVSARGLDGERAQLLLEEVSSVDPSDVRLVASEEVELMGTGDRVVLVAGPDALDFGTQTRRFRLRVEPREDERITDDNELPVTVRINTQKIRVLYVDGYPRWEYRFLKEELRRMDARILVQMYLMSATPDFNQDRTRGLASLERVPTSREELLENYDVVILGDVNPYDVSPDPARGREFVESLRTFVERGGGLCIIAGQYDMPRSVAGTEFAEVLPVEFDRAGVSVTDVPTTREWGYLLEDAAAPHEIVRLESDVETNRALWEGPEALRGFYWHYPVNAVRPGSQVLLRHPELSLGDGREKDPLLVVGYYPSGRTMFLAMEATYRWRNRYGYRYYEGFWRNALRWLALGRMRGEDRRFELNSLRSEYDIAERVTLEARVLTEDFQPSEAAGVDVVLTGPGGDRTDLELAPVTGRPGLFRGTSRPDRPGRYRAEIPAGGPDGPDQAVSAEFEVVLPSRESQDPSPDPAAMRQLAELTDGTAVTVASLSDIEGAFPPGNERKKPISAELEDAWDRLGTLLLALGLLSAEWILRKRSQLV